MGIAHRKLSKLVCGNFMTRTTFGAHFLLNIFFLFWISYIIGTADRSVLLDKTPYVCIGWLYARPIKRARPTKQAIEYRKTQPLNSVGIFQFLNGTPRTDIIFVPITRAWVVLCIFVSLGHERISPWQRLSGERKYSPLLE